MEKILVGRGIARPEFTFIRGSDARYDRLMVAHADIRRVHYRKYPGAVDLTGKNLLRLLDHRKAEVSPLVGGIAPKSEMAVVELPLKAVTSDMTGDVADEIHEWPNAKLGATFRHLALHFVDDRLVEAKWGVSPYPASARRPWYRRLLGR
jgi:hypothetical protein